MEPQPVEEASPPGLAEPAAPPKKRRNGDEEKRLLAACAEGDRDALARLYDRFNSLLFALILRIVGDPGHAEDVLQEAFLYAWNRAGHYDPKRSSVSTWLALIARSRAIDRIRKTKNQGRVADEFESDQATYATPAKGPSTVLESQRRRRLNAALNELPPPQRQVLELAYFGGMTQAEIAQRTSTPLGTVKTRTVLALRKLRASLATEADQLI